MQCKELENGGLSTDYISYFIEVENGLEDLSDTKIKVHPLVIFPNGEIHNIVFSHDKIFICKGSVNDKNIIGCATLENDGDECLYRTYRVDSCDIVEYIKYIESFKENYNKCIMSNVIEGEIVTYK